MGRYEIVKELGKGAMGEVYLANDAHIDRHVAIKTFRFGREIDEKSLRTIKENLLREARMAGKLSHPPTMNDPNIQFYLGRSPNYHK